jgi:hypothetical protein
MRFFKRYYIGGKRFSQEWQAAIEAYRVHFQSIEDRLPESARQFEKHIRRRPLHDEGVDSITRPARGVVHVELMERRLEFLGVTECEFPQPLEEQTVWLYEEIDLPRAGVLELSALFDQGEFRIVAREVRVLDKLSKRYAVPNDPK